MDSCDIVFHFVMKNNAFFYGFTVFKANTSSFAGGK